MSAITDLAVEENKHLGMPEGLDEDGKRAWELIVEALVKHDLTFTGSQKTFYSPQEWAKRNEDYGTDSKLIVVYDGGDVGGLFDPTQVPYSYDQFGEAFRNSGFTYEPCTHWYSAVYPVRKPAPVNTQVVIVMEGGVVDHVAVFDASGQALPFREVVIDYDVDRDECGDDIHDLPQSNSDFDTAKARVSADDVVEPTGMCDYIKNYLTEKGLLKGSKSSA